jgi:hypothetical protein
LCKLAPEAGRNPNNTLFAAQLDQCCRLLQLELTALRPAHALVMADVGWWWPFVAHLGVTVTPTPRAPVLATSRFAGTSLVFTGRPEGKSEAQHVTAIVEAFHSLRHA